MNPVDHPHGGVSAGNPRNCRDAAYLTNRHRVTINILVRRRPSRGTPPRVKRLVSLLRAGRVCCVVPRRSRIKLSWFYIWARGSSGCIGLSLLCSYGDCEGGQEDLLFYASIMAVNETKIPKRGWNEACLQGNVLEDPASQGKPSSRRTPLGNQGASFPIQGH